MDRATHLRVEEEPALRVAAQWLLELQSTDVSVERIAQWQQWIGADARNQQAFCRIEALMGIADEIDSAPHPSAAELAADRYDAAVSVSAWRASNPRQAAPTRRRRWPVMGAALAASVLLGFALTIAGYPRQLSIPGLFAYQRIETAAGGTLKVILADDSAIDVGGQSILRTMLTDSAREVTLTQGEAFFRVAKDPGRPFTVRAGSTVITAVGTAFNVRRSGERVVVAVAEGMVRVSSAGSGPGAETSIREAARPTQLRAGELLSVERGGAAPAVESIDTQAVAGWRSGRLRYLNEPLASVVADVSRYTAREIEIADPSLNELRITGTVLEHNLDGWLSSLEEAFPVHVVRANDGAIRLEAREQR